MYSVLQYLFMETFDSKPLYWQRKGSHLDLGINFKEIETEGRIVVGFATLDNVDLTNDIVPLEASIKAFENFRGNIRLQHDKTKPVGKMKGFEVADYYDEETDQTYKGIKVAVQISKGAEDVWEMVKDGTLSAFSIGAAVKKASKVFDAKLQKEIQIIEDYVLFELSLVDSPANQLANVVSFYKSIDPDIEVEKSFEGNHFMYCGIDRMAMRSENPQASCPKCGEQMANLGHISHNTDMQTQLNKVLEGQTIQKGGHPEVAVEKENKEVPEVDEIEVDESAEIAETEVEPEASTEEVVVETAEVEEETVAEVDTEIEDVTETVDTEAALTEESIRAMLEDFRSVLVEEFATASRKGFDEMLARFEDVQKGFTELAKTFSEVKEAHESVTKRLDSAESNITKTNERLDVVDDTSAVKKSLESESVNTSEVVEKKNPFDGFFSKDLDWD